MSNGRVPYPPKWWRARTFDEVRKTALEMAHSPNTSPHLARMLRVLESCEYLDGKQDHEGATYKSVAYAGRLYGLDAEQRREWIEVAEMLGLAQHHVGHIIANAPAPTGEYRAGDEVRHKKFGLGTVVEVRESVLYVEFGGEVKSFVPEYVPTIEPGDRG